MNETIQARIVRGYTPDERAAVTPGDQETPSRRFERLVATHEIDAARYREAAKQYPERAAHFERLIEIGDRAIAGWAQYYHQQHGVDTGVVPEVITQMVIPYDGSEPAHTQHTVRVPNPAWADMPA